MSSDIFFGLIIAVAALAFIYPMFIFCKIYDLTKQMPFRQRWLMFLILIMFFFVSYILLSLRYLLNWADFNNDTLIAIIMLFGAFFVYLTATLFYRIINELQAKYRESIQKEKEVSRLKDQFLFMAAHELRTPVTAMKWVLDLLFNDDSKLLKKCTEENLDFVNDLRRNNEYLVDLVNDLLDASRMESGTFSLHYEPVDPADLAKDVLATVKGLAKERGLKTGVSFQDEPCTIDSDPRRLKEILMNLLSNAIKYNIDGGRVDIKIHSGDDFLQFDVIDTGIGISAEDKGKLFQKFSRLEADASEGVHGTGLGLFIVRLIVEKMGGRIWVESPGLGQGTTFSFTLPKKYQAS